MSPKKLACHCNALAQAEREDTKLAITLQAVLTFLLEGHCLSIEHQKKLNHMKRTSIYYVATGVLMVIASAFRPTESSVYQFDYENVLGTSFQLKVGAISEDVANLAEQIALEEIDRLTGILSTYDPSSEISQWQKTRDIEIKVSTELFEVLCLFDDWEQRTSGALSASIGIASNMWRKAEINQQAPDSHELSFVVDAMKSPQWILNREAQTAVHLSNQPLLLNTFVKSYIISKVSNTIISIPGVVSAVTNIGGDIVIAGAQSETVYITDPTADAENDQPVTILSLQQRAIATSGNYRRGFQIGNQWYSHIIDPRTAIPASGTISATVVAENGTDAGALATAFNILSPDESEALAEKIPGVEYQILTKDGKEIVSKGWKALEVKKESNVSNNKVSSHTEEKHKLTIEFELARFEGRFRRPFVAVWLENKKKSSVRTVALWYNKPRWLPDLKRWYSKNQSMIQDLPAMESISSATRSAGKYSLSWDGLDDKGKSLPPGVYTIYIEAAREHGTYQLIKQEIDWKGKPKHFDLKGGVEITSVSLDLIK